MGLQGWPWASQSLSRTHASGSSGDTLPGSQAARDQGGLAGGDRLVQLCSPGGGTCTSVAWVLGGHRKPLARQRQTCPIKGLSPAMRQSSGSLRQMGTPEPPSSQPKPSTGPSAAAAGLWKEGGRARSPGWEQGPLGHPEVSAHRSVPESPGGSTEEGTQLLLLADV